MRTVGANRAKQQLSRLLNQVERGAEILITRNGIPVARLVPAKVHPVIRSPEASRQARTEMIRLMEKGLDLGGRGFTRDDMHDG